VTIIDWNGRDLPADLRNLPAGKYVLQPVDDLPSLSDEEERGLATALDSLQRGAGLPHEQVRASVLKRTGG
jgi:hypothetical protein